MWIAAVSRGHNSGVCLLKDGEIVFSIEEERLSRNKYDSAPFLSIAKIKEYTDQVDYFVVTATSPMEGPFAFDAPKVEYVRRDPYVYYASKLGLIKNFNNKLPDTEQSNVIDLGQEHHRVHAATAFYRSGFDKAVAVVIDGCGSLIGINEDTAGFEVESIYECSYPHNIKTIYKHICVSSGKSLPYWFNNNYKFQSEIGEENIELLFDSSSGIVKAYEAVTKYCGFNEIEAGKTMGLFPYGKQNDRFGSFYSMVGEPEDLVFNSDKNMIIPRLPAGATFNYHSNKFLNFHESDDVTLLENRRDAAYAVQKESQYVSLQLIKKAVNETGNKNIVISGGYGLNCVANYYYLEELNKEGINLYVDPMCNDGGTAVGAALFFHHVISKEENVKSRITSIYNGPEYDYSFEEIDSLADKYDGIVKETNKSEIVDLLRNKNIVTIFQGRSENGPRALGNRSILFDPTFEDGKDFVNEVKRREYFRPFAGSVLHEHANEWFDMRGLDESPFMMYAVNCKEEYKDKIPSIIHVDGTCRIQTVKREQNQHFYDLIEEFYKQTNIPILFNTSFNLGGDPLVETLEDAMNTLYRSDIEYLYLPEHELLVKIENKD